MDDLQDCAVTFDEIRDELEDIERALARRFGIRGAAVRRRLIEMDDDGQLVEDDLVADWHEAYSSYLAWARRTEWELDEESSSGGGPDPDVTTEENSKQAAQAAFAL
jgi:hypothetical protein